MTFAFITVVLFFFFFSLHYFNKHTALFLSLMCHTQFYMYSCRCLLTVPLAALPSVHARAQRAWYRKSRQSMGVYFLAALGHCTRQIFCQALSCNTDGRLNTKSLKVVILSGQEENTKVSSSWYSYQYCIAPCRMWCVAYTVVSTVVYLQDRKEYTVIYSRCWRPTPNSGLVCSFDGEEFSKVYRDIKIHLAVQMYCTDLAPTCFWLFA